jgi:hypothetical protein
MEDFHTDHSAAGDEQRTPSSMPPCCGSGCAVCVLDYWVDDEPGVMTQEEITGNSVGSEMLVLLEAFEEAERQAKQMIAQTDESE